MIGREIDRDEGPETRLHIGQEEGQNIEAVIGVDVAEPPCLDRVAHMAMKRRDGCQRRGDELVQELFSEDRGAVSPRRRPVHWHEPSLLAFSRAVRQREEAGAGVLPAGF
jgi:hypothetical protein